MDPHSRLVQFNQRPPKIGPKAASRGYMESPKLTLESFTKKASTPTRKSSSPAPALVRRPIATNSRIRQDEQYRKDMYLAFVNNALQQKLEVSKASEMFTRHRLTSVYRETASPTMNLSANSTRSGSTRRTSRRPRSCDSGSSPSHMSSPVWSALMHPWSRRSSMYHGRQWTAPPSSRSPSSSACC